jgi:hypothetical protein
MRFSGFSCGVFRGAGCGVRKPSDQSAAGRIIFLFQGATFIIYATASLYPLLTQSKARIIGTSGTTKSANGMFNALNLTINEIKK